MSRTVLEYYRIYVGWAENAGTLEVALKDFRTLSPDGQSIFQEILRSAVARESIHGIDNLRDAAKFINK